MRGERGVCIHHLFIHMFPLLVHPSFFFPFLFFFSVFPLPISPTFFTPFRSKGELKEPHPAKIEPAMEETATNGATGVGTGWAFFVRNKADRPKDDLHTKCG